MSCTQVGHFILTHTVCATFQNAMETTIAVTTMAIRSAARAMGIATMTGTAGGAAGGRPGAERQIATGNKFFVLLTRVCSFWGLGGSRPLNINMSV